MSLRVDAGRRSWPRAAEQVARGAAGSLYQHWGLALFSLAAAFAIWFVIQDVENPRVEAVFPAEGQPASIEVRAINADTLIPNQEFTVRVRVEGREDDLASLSDDEFEATIDVKGIPALTRTDVTVRVTTSRSGLRVLSVDPATVTVELEPVEEREVTVTINSSGQLGAGLEVQDAAIQPLTVKVSGLKDRLDTVVSVDLDVNRGALGEGTNEIEGDLTARNANGGEVAVTITPARATVSYTISQAFVQRTLPVGLTFTGQVAAGYRIAGVVIEPPLLSATGPEGDFANLTQLVTEPIPLTNATSEIRRVQNIDLQGRNISPERRQVSVRIVVEPILCGTTNPACPAVTLQLAPGVTNPPAGMFVQGTLSVLVRLSGPFLALQDVNPREISASVNLATPAAPGVYPITVTLPTAMTNLGIRAEPVDPIPVTLGPNP